MSFTLILPLILDEISFFTSSETAANSIFDTSFLSTTKLAPATGLIVPSTIDDAKISETVFFFI